MNEIKVPILPESITDAVVVAINKNVGDNINSGECMFELETDKVVLEVPSEESGVITEIKVKNGDTVIESQVLATMEIKDISDTPVEIVQQTEKVVTEMKEPKKIEQQSNPQAANIVASPSVRKALRESGLSIDEVASLNKGGKISKQDLANAQSDNSTQQTTTDNRMEERVPMSRMRKTIAGRLLSASQQTAMLTTFNEVDMTNIMALRKKYQDNFIKEHDVKLGFMSLFVKAATESLKKYPVINSSLDNDAIVYHGFCDISVAVSTEKGLVVPVLRDTQDMSLADIENKIIDFATRAQSGKLEISEMRGGTFTITNGGVFGSLLSTPIINPPQSAVLGMHGIQKRPVVIDDEIVARPMMYLALSYDHMVVDGKDAVTFLKHIKELIEDPSRIILEI